LYYGNSDAIADNFDTKSTRPHSAAYIYLFILPSRPASGLNLLIFSFQSLLSDKNQKKIEKKFKLNS
jgi:hypothetical protein